MSNLQSVCTPSESEQRIKIDIKSFILISEKTFPCQTRSSLFFPYFFFDKEIFFLIQHFGPQTVKTSLTLTASAQIRTRMLAEALGAAILFTSRKEQISVMIIPVKKEQLLAFPVRSPPFHGETQPPWHRILGSSTNSILIVSSHP